MDVTIENTMDEPTPARHSERIRTLNDLLRQEGVGGRLMLTRGLAGLPRSIVARIITAVRSFEAFTEANDPYGEHDCGTLTVGEHRVIWKIDYYDCRFLHHSPDPADATRTCRVLTVMLAEEY